MADDIQTSLDGDDAPSTSAEGTAGAPDGGAAGPTLEGSASPFLAHGATQPVAWMPWGDSAFERARAEDRPILLDIGAVWCHWCHVMDRESYEDPETAALINELYVPVKVDRDERPDVDARYQRAVQAMTGQGGWPLTAFLTPSGETFFGGTYFPPTDAEGRPAFRRVLAEMARVWAQDRERAVRAAGSLAERIAPLPPERMAATLSRDAVFAGIEAFAGIFDVRAGGFGTAPKFPNPGALLLLLDRHLDTGEAWMRRVVGETLDGMARGGIHDQLGGAFHRYSVDARWLVPHFEKMAYDNGPLLEIYARAHAVTGESSWADVCRGVLRYYREVGAETIEDGGFPASQDADTGADDDGAYWTWTPAEVREAVDDNDLLLRAATLRYGLDDEAAALHSDPSRRVLWLARPVDDVAGALGLSERETGRMLEHVARALRAARSAREAPYVDRTVYTGWTALVASGFLAAARFLGETQAGIEALRALDRCWRDGWRDGAGVAHRVAPAGAGGVALLEDQAYLLLALLDAFELYGRHADLDRARRVSAVILERFREPSSGALRDRPVGEEAGALAVPVYAPTDSPTPSPPAAAALGMSRLAALSAGAQAADLRAAAAGVLEAIGQIAARAPTAMATWLRAADWATGPVSTLVVVAEEADAPLWRTALAMPRPRTVVRRIHPGAEGEGHHLPEAVRAMMDGAAPRAYLCVGRTCAPPATEPEALEELLRSYHG